MGPADAADGAGDLRGPLPVGRECAAAARVVAALALSELHATAARRARSSGRPEADAPSERARRSGDPVAGASATTSTSL